eukprot:6210809-Pleurochrysis_carterae.AAC.6
MRLRRSRDSPGGRLTITRPVSAVRLTQVRREIRVPRLLRRYMRALRDAGIQFVPEYSRAFGQCMILYTLHDVPLYILERQMRARG